MQRYEGKKVVIIGGTTGMGLATAQALLAEGAHVAITGRSEANLTSALQKLGNNAHAIRADLSQSAESAHISNFIAETWGKIDFLFVNAGIADLEPVALVTEESYDRAFNINTRGTFFTTQRLIPLIKDGGSIVFTSSVADGEGNPGMGVYTGTKAALRAFAQVIASELLPRSIRVNVVSPGFIKTESMGTASLSEEERAAFEKLGDIVTPMKRHGSVEEVARAVLFLAFEATFTTGSVLHVDGGLGQGLKYPTPLA